MKEFKINKYLSLKLENNETNIYINNTKFIQCKYLLLHTKTQDIEDLFLIESVDELAESLTSALEFKETESFKISPETEFWGHCSNLQTWFESNYNSKLLKSNLAFPLLKKLSEVGDPLAKIYFKEEIAKRLSSCNFSVVQYLIEEEYINYLSNEELLFSILDLNDAQIIKDLEEFLGIDIPFISELKDGGEFGYEITIKEKHVKSLSLCGIELSVIPDSIGGFRQLERLDLSLNNLKSIPESISKLKSLKILNLEYNQLEEVPISIYKLKSLEVLKLGNNKIKYVSQSIEDLKVLRILDLMVNELISLPTTIGDLPLIESVDLSFNLINNLPNSIGNLKSLIDINFENNSLIELPESFFNLKKLENLKVQYNRIQKLPENIENLSNLKYLNLNHNNLVFLPKSIGNLDKLNYLSIENNNITKLPNNIINLKSLEYLSLKRNNLNSLPKNFEKLKSLKILDIKNNYIDKTSECLRILPNQIEVFI